MPSPPLSLVEQGLGIVSESVCRTRHELSFCFNDYFQVEGTSGTGTVLAIGTFHGSRRAVSTRI